MEVSEEIVENVTRNLGKDVLRTFALTTASTVGMMLGITIFFGLAGMVTTRIEQLDALKKKAAKFDDLTKDEKQD